MSESTAVMLTVPGDPIAIVVDGIQRCGAKTRPSARYRHCRQRAGHRTDHVGQGRCRLHGGATPVASSGRYSKITRPRIAALVQAFSEDPDPLDLTPEVHALRALVVDYIERWDETTEALLAWHASFDVGQPNDATALPVDGQPVTPAPPVAQRPRKVLDLSDAAKLLDYVGKMVERVEKIRVGSHISEHPEFRRITREMGRHVMANVPDIDVLARIHAGWNSIPR